MHQLLRSLPIALVAGAAAGEVVIDAAATAVAGDADSTLVLRCASLTGKDSKGNPGAGLTIVLPRRGGAWQPDQARVTAGWLFRPKVQIDAAALRQTGDRIEGALSLVLWSPQKDETGPPADAQRLALSVNGTVQRGEAMAPLPDPLAYMPPWRKEVPNYGGWIVTGTWKADGSGEGQLSGAFNAATAVGAWGGESTCTVAAGTAGLAVLCRLSPKRVSAPHGARAIYTLPKPLDGRGSAGLRLVVDGPRRDGPTVTLAVREADGSWWSCVGAGLLSGRDTSNEVRWSDFRRAGFDEDYALDRSALSAIAVGCDDSSGVGDVRFTLKRVELLDGEATIQVVPQVTVSETVESIEGTDRIPPGLFGMHDVRGKAKPEETRDPIAYLKQIRPGFMRSIEHTGFGGVKDPPDVATAIKLLADRPKAKTAADDPNWLRYVAAEATDAVVIGHSQNLWARPSWMDQGLDGFCANIESFYRQIAIKSWVPGDERNVRRRYEVWNEPFMWGRHFNMGERNPAGKQAWTDPGQHGYLPASVGAEAYARIFLAACAGAKPVNPHILLGGPSSAGFHEDDWTSFTLFTGPILDRVHDQIDFITEHHYQGEPDSYAASTLAVGAWCAAKYGRRIPICNTETNDRADIPTKGDGGQPAHWTEKEAEMNLAHYNLVDILSHARFCPDVAFGRAMHALWDGGFCRNAGETNVYSLLAPLRGRRLAITGDPRLVCAATTPEPGTIVLVVHNAGEERIHGTSVVPAGFAVASSTRLTFGEKGTALEDLPAGAALDYDLKPRFCQRWILKKAGWNPTAEIRWRWVPWVKVQTRIAPGAELAGPLRWNDRDPKGAKAAFVRLITRDAQRGEATAVIAGKKLAVPWSSANEGAQGIADLPIDPQSLTKDSQLSIVCAPTGNGLTVLAAMVYYQE